MVEKNPLFAVQFIATNAIKDANVLETGHSTRILIELRRKRDRKRRLSGPSRSLMNPYPRRPTTDERLNPATNPAAVLAERPKEVL